jgi:hypothetical protein
MAALHPDPAAAVFERGCFAPQILSSVPPADQLVFVRNATSQYFQMYLDHRPGWQTDRQDANALDLHE